MPDPDPESRAEAAASLVRQLRPLIGDLYEVRETAEIIVADAVERSAAGAGALLVPDGARWRVAAGVRLRPLEHRYELDADSWLVQQIARGDRGAIIDDTDVARTPLHGAPLASHRHLLAVPVPTVQGLLLVARDDGPGFTKEDLLALVHVGREAAPLLSAALETRELARSLAQFADLDGLAP